MECKLYILKNCECFTTLMHQLIRLYLCIQNALVYFGYTRDVYESKMLVYLTPKWGITITKQELRIKKMLRKNNTDRAN